MKWAIPLAVVLIWFLALRLALRWLREPMEHIVDTIDSARNEALSTDSRDILALGLKCVLGALLTLVAFLWLYRPTVDFATRQATPWSDLALRKLRVPVARQVDGGSLTSSKYFSGNEIFSYSLQQTGPEFYLTTESVLREEGGKILVHKELAFRNSDVERTDAFSIVRNTSADGTRLGWIVRIPLRRSIEYRRATMLRANARNEEQPITDPATKVELAFLRRGEAVAAESQFRYAIGYR